MSTNTQKLTVPAANEGAIATPAELPAFTQPSTVVVVDTLLLQDALAKYVKVITNKNARRVIQGIHIAANGDHLDLCGTDLEVALHMTVPATMIITPSNAIVADYKTLLNAVKAVKDRQTRLALHGEYLIVADSGSSTHVSSFGEVEDFPPLPRRLTLEECLAAKEAHAPAEQKQNAKKFEEAKDSWRKTLSLEFQEFAVPAESLSAALQYVLPGIAEERTRYALGGVFMTGNNRDSMELVSTNTHVLFRHDVILTAGTLPGNAGFIMLSKMAEWLTKNACGTLTVKTDPYALFIEGEGFTLAGRRIEGVFPRYQDVIPEQSRMPGRLTVNRKEFLAALKAARPHASSETRRVDLMAGSGGNGLIIRAVCGSTTTFTTEIPAASRKWLADSFVADFLIDFLTVHPGDTVTICRDKALSKCGGPSAVYDGERLHLIMPVNNGIKPTPEELEAYRVALAGPDQEFPGSSTPMVKIAKKAPAFKAVVAHAKADSGYLSKLLSALGVQVAAAV